MSRNFAISSILLFCTLIVFKAGGQTQEEWRATETQNNTDTDPPTTPTPYQGVHPGSGNQLPRVADLSSKSGAYVTWPGFRQLENRGSELFLQTTRTLQYQVTQSGNTTTISLGKTFVYLGNNRNPLITSHFDTPLKQAFFKTKKKKLVLILEMKTPVTPEVSQSTHSDGFHYLFIRFPPQSKNTSQ